MPSLPSCSGFNFAVFISHPFCKVSKINECSHAKPNCAPNCAGWIGSRQTQYATPSITLITCANALNLSWRMISLPCFDPSPSPSPHSVPLPSLHAAIDWAFDGIIYAFSLHLNVAVVVVVPVPRFTEGVLHTVYGRSGSFKNKFMIESCLHRKPVINKPLHWSGYIKGVE